MAETMRIAESYFQRLLRDTPAPEAVSELAGMWQPRITDAGPLFGLSRPEHCVEMVRLYTGEVGNGGHVQFFLNQRGNVSRHVGAALRELGLGDLLEIFQAACALFPSSTVPALLEDVERVVAGWSKAERDALNDLDPRVWDFPDLENQLLDYLRRNEEQILREERGLPSIS